MQELNKPISKLAAKVDCDCARLMLAHDLLGISWFRKFRWFCVDVFIHLEDVVDRHGITRLDRERNQYELFSIRDDLFCRAGRSAARVRVEEMNDDPPEYIAVTASRAIKVENIGYNLHKRCLNVATAHSAARLMAIRDLRVLIWDVYEDFDTLEIYMEELCWGSKQHARENFLDRLLDMCDLCDILLP